MTFCFALWLQWRKKRFYVSVPFPRNNNLQHFLENWISALQLFVKFESAKFWLSHSNQCFGRGANASIGKPRHTTIYNFYYFLWYYQWSMSLQNTDMHHNWSLVPKTWECVWEKDRTVWVRVDWNRSNEVWTDSHQQQSWKWGHFPRWWNKRKKRKCYFSLLWK